MCKLFGSESSLKIDYVIEYIICDWLHIRLPPVKDPASSGVIIVYFTFIS